MKNNDKSLSVLAQYFSGGERWLKLLAVPQTRITATSEIDRDPYLLSPEHVMTLKLVVLLVNIGERSHGISSIAEKACLFFFYYKKAMSKSTNSLWQNSELNIPQHS